MKAEEDRRSLNQAALAQLKATLAARHRTGDQIVASLRRLHERMAGMPPLTDAFLNRAKAHRRS